MGLISVNSWACMMHQIRLMRTWFHAPAIPERNQNKEKDKSSWPFLTCSSDLKNWLAVKVVIFLYFTGMQPVLIVWDFTGMKPDLIVLHFTGMKPDLNETQYDVNSFGWLLQVFGDFLIACKQLFGFCGTLRIKLITEQMYFQIFKFKIWNISFHTWKWRYET